MNETLERLRKRALFIGIAGLVLSVAFALAFSNINQFFHSYLLAFSFWVGLPLGSLAILFLHQLTGGRWGAVIRRILEAATRTIPLLAILFIPVLVGIHRIYIWSDPAVIQHDEILQHKEPYLNIPFFIIRAVLYFAIWTALTFAFARLSRKQEESADAALVGRFQKLSGIGLLLYGLTATYASVDWFMSLEPHWFSTIYGLIIITGQVLNSFAFAIVVATLLSQYSPLSDFMGREQFKDLGNLTLTFVMLWAYMSFSQLLIIWSGNLPEEIPWYVHRFHAGWQWLGAILIVFHFAVPFLILLSRAAKKNSRVLVWVAIGLMVMRLADLFWLIAPEFHEKGFHFHPLDILLPIGMGGIWIAYYLRQLNVMPVVAVNDPNFSGAEI
jgi:hypothetical protein